MSEIIELTVTNGKPTTTSLAIAERFGKQHKNVLQSIERLECPEEFNRLNFQPVAYKGGNGELRPMYAVTKDGFMFLAMGFTGKEAAAWKVKFIEAFNAMERQLLENAAAQQIPKPDGTLFLSHSADIMVAADRIFRGMVRSSRSAGLALPAALRRANAVALERTGINMLDALQAHDHVHDLEAKQAAKDAPADMAVPVHVVEFLQMVKAGEFGAFWKEPFLSTQLYRMYRHWCRETGEIYPVRIASVIVPARASGQFTRKLKRYMEEDGRPSNPSSFLYPLGVYVPAGSYEPEWLGECIRRTEDVLKAFEA